jgi:hypothetical protein
MSTTQPSPLLSLPAELRIEIYDALFLHIHQSSIRGATSLLPLLQVSRQICAEATPRMRLFVKSRVDQLQESLNILDQERDAAELEWEAAGNATGNATGLGVLDNQSFRAFQDLEEAFYRDQRGKFQMLGKRLRNVAAMAERRG